MTVPAALAAAIGERLSGAVSGGTRIAGGYLNDAWRIELEDGRSAFVKTAADAPRGGYATEAAGLRWLAEPGALPVPEVLGVVDASEIDEAGGPAEPASGAPVAFLALEWIAEGRLDGAGEEELGRGLAAVHAAGAAAFGGPEPLRIGPIELPNGPTDSWIELYAEQRLRPLTARAASQGALPDGTEALIDRVCERLPELAGPPEPPARLHGDLWSGNVLADSEGRPHLIDPAAYGGHREIDLAMLRLFGGPGERCFAAYAEVAPLADGYEQRVSLWQLFPLLLHAVLFGSGYGASVAEAARRYVR